MANIATPTPNQPTCVPPSSSEGNQDPFTPKEKRAKRCGEARFCADITESGSVDTEEEITEEYCEKKIVIAKSGAESAAGPHAGGKEGQPQHDTT